MTLSEHTYPLARLAEITGSRLTGEPETVITGACGFHEAGPGEISFVDGSRLARKLHETRAGALILRPDIEYDGPALRHDDPRAVFAIVLGLFETPRQRIFPPGIHASAVIDPSAELGENLSIGPHVVIGAQARIGDGCMFGPGVIVEPDVQIGTDCLFYAHVTVRERCILGSEIILHPGVVVGSDGFGYHAGASGLTRIPQIGIVVLEDRVEIGANSCVDRATTGETRIAAGTKIDNLVQVGHNVTIGRHCAISAQSGISGSCTLGQGVVVGGQVGIADHLKLGDGVKVAAKSGITRDIEPGTSVFGYPATEFRKGFRIVACTHRLPEMMKRLDHVEKALDNIVKTEDD